MPNKGNSRAQLQRKFKNLYGFFPHEEECSECHRARRLHLPENPCQFVPTGRKADGAR
jgi:hypothetical protein